MCSGASSGLTGLTTPAVAPARSTTGASMPFGRTKATVSPGPTPRRRKRFAARVTSARSSAQVRVTALSFGPDRSWKVIAGRSGKRPAVSLSCS